jgi:hypothetical protein
MELFSTMHAPKSMNQLWRLAPSLARIETHAGCCCVRQCSEPAAEHYSLNSEVEMPIFAHHRQARGTGAVAASFCHQRRMAQISGSKAV